MSPIESTVSDWPGIEVGPHDRGGREFTLDGREIGHVHRRTLFDIGFTRRIRDILIEEGRAQKHHVLPDSGAVSYRITSDENVDGALWLLRVSYLYHRILLEADEETTLEGAGVDIDAELAALDVSDDLRRVFSELRRSNRNRTVRSEDQ